MGACNATKDTGFEPPAREDSTTMGACNATKDTGFEPPAPRADAPERPPSSRPSNGSNATGAGAGEGGFPGSPMPGNPWTEPAHQTNWSLIPQEDLKILRPCYGCAPIDETQVQEQPRVSRNNLIIAAATMEHRTSHNSDGKVSYGVVPDGGQAVDEDWQPGDELPTDWETLQRLAREGKIKIHEDNEQQTNVETRPPGQITHEEIRPGVFRANGSQTQRTSANGRYSYDPPAGQNNLQINMMHEIPFRGSRASQNRETFHRESRTSQHSRHSQAEAQKTTEVTLEDEAADSKREEVTERRESRESNRREDKEAEQEAAERREDKADEQE